MVVLEDQKQLDKYLTFRDKLPMLQAVIMWNAEVPTAVNTARARPLLERLPLLRHLHQSDGTRRADCAHQAGPLRFAHLHFGHDGQPEGRDDVARQSHL